MNDIDIKIDGVEEGNKYFLNKINHHFVSMSCNYLHSPGGYWLTS